MAAGRAYSGKPAEGEQEADGAMKGHAEGYTNITLSPQEKNNTLSHCFYLWLILLILNYEAIDFKYPGKP